MIARPHFIRIVVSLVLALPFSTSIAAWSQDTKASADQAQKGEYTFKSETRLVNIFTTVTDRYGAPVADLKKDDFKLAEDGELQDIRIFNKESELPLSVVLAIDTSLSTRKDIKLELESARRFVHSILRPVDRLSLFAFAQDVDQLVPFSADLPRIDRAIRGIRSGASSSVYDALYLGSEVLRDRQGRKVVVMITDGEDNGSKVTYPSAVRGAQEAEAIVYSVIVIPVVADAGRNVAGENAMIQISQDTGGKHYYAANIPQLDAAFKQISEELRTQYLLAYYPTKTLSDSDFRRIEVTLDRPELTARHRTGYYTH